MMVVVVMDFYVALMSVTDQRFTTAITDCNVTQTGPPCPLTDRDNPQLETFLSNSQF